MPHDAQRCITNPRKIPHKHLNTGYLIYRTNPFAPQPIRRFESLTLFALRDSLR